MRAGAVALLNHYQGNHYAVTQQGQHLFSQAIVVNDRIGRLAAGRTADN